METEGVSNFMDDGGSGPASAGEGDAVHSSGHSHRGAAASAGTEVDVGALVASWYEPQACELVVVVESSLQSSLGFLASSDCAVHVVGNGHGLTTLSPETSPDGSECEFAFFSLFLLVRVQDHVTLKSSTILHLFHPRMRSEGQQGNQQ